MTPKLYKAADVCEMAQLQPYVLRSWEKEFPGIGVQGKSPDSPRLYRQADVDHVQRIKQLVFGEGLTVAGARRKLEAEAPLLAVLPDVEASEVLDALGADVKARLAVVRDGLRALQSMLANPPASNGHATRRAVGRSAAKRSAAPARNKTVKRGATRKVAATAAKKKTTRKKRIGA